MTDGLAQAKLGERRVVLADVGDQRRAHAIEAVDGLFYWMVDTDKGIRTNPSVWSGGGMFILECIAHDYVGDSIWKVVDDEEA